MARSQYIRGGAGRGINIKTLLVAAAAAAHVASWLSLSSSPRTEGTPTSPSVSPRRRGSPWWLWADPRRLHYTTTNRVDARGQCGHSASPALLHFFQRHPVCLRVLLHDRMPSPTAGKKKERSKSPPPWDKKGLKWRGEIEKEWKKK